MKGLGDVNVFVYNKEEDANSKGMQIKARFKAIVNKVIDELKKKGEINYKKFRAADIAQFLIH